MKNLTFLLVTLISSIMLSLSGTFAAPIQYPVPKSAFPAHSEQFTYDVLSNEDWNCEWAMSCEEPPVPVFHDQESGDLGRLSGWIESAYTKNGSKNNIGWALTANTFENEVDAEAAAQDYADTARNYGAIQAKSQPALLPAGELGGADLILYRSTYQHYAFYLILAFDKTAEVEAVARFNWLGKKRDVTRRGLAKIARLALIYQLQNG